MALIRQFAAFCTVISSVALAAPAISAATATAALPRPDQPFTGKLAPTVDDADTFAPQPVQAPKDAPNIVLVLTDDVGFAAASTFGGPVPTPNLDRLAAQGLKYNQFHTTGICSPTRAALLTGRNHHAVATGTVVESPYPGYNWRMPKSAATVARILRDNGYNTAMFGKDHNVPHNALSPAGPFDQWPTGRGFEYFYGFLAGDTNQWQPTLIEGITPLDSAGWTDGKLLDERLADRAIRWIHNQKAAAPNKPFFLYYAPGTAHAPHQAPKAWIERFRGRFDQGWDQLSEEILARQQRLGIVPASVTVAPRPTGAPAWVSLSATEKRVYARYMEVFAATLAFQDAQFGRLLDEIERMGIADNTLVMFIEGDNGASGEGGEQGTMNEMIHLSSPAGDGMHDLQWLSENLDLLGGPLSYETFQMGWTYATNTPFPWMKQLASHLGGVRNGLVVSWPQKISARGEVRSQYHHVIDIMPTLLDAAQVEAPASVDGIEQQRIDGVSMAYTFDTASAPSQRQTQYYETNGNRGIYHDGWLASTTPRGMPWDFARAKGSDTATYDWELYDLRNDFAQRNNLAAAQPEKLREMQQLFDAEARRNNVYPIQDYGGQARSTKMILNSHRQIRSDYVYWGPDISLPLMAAPQIFFMPFSLEAELQIPVGGASGVVVAAGSRFGGWSFYLQDGKPVAYAAASQLPGLQTRISAAQPLPTGKVKLRYDFSHDGDGGTLKISVNGKQVATGKVAHRPHMMAGNGETFDTGRDTNTPVSDDYADGGAFSGTIERIEVKIALPMGARAMNLFKTSE